MAEHKIPDPNQVFANEYGTTVYFLSFATVLTNNAQGNLKNL